MSKRAWVTLATNDSYGLGALVLAYSLRRVGSVNPAVVLITPSVTDAMKNRLSAVFADVVTVDVLDSRDAAHLALLQRPELGITFTKIHCWSLTQYEKCVFLDADTLVVQNCDELFEREELSAAPDVGWPDCFNSGVFVYRPSSETFDKLIAFAKERGSFDGGDQGLLNAFFSDWAHGDINKHLPFLYNVTSAAFYSYLPALKHYGENLKIIHFIGAAKPWLQHYNWESGSVEAPDHLREFLQLWWNLFTSQVHSQLDESMTGVAGNLARVVPGAAGSREAMDELTRRQGWEAGNIDYMGADSFANIWAKISQTLSEPRVSPPKQSPPQESTSPKQPSPPPKEPSPPKQPSQPEPLSIEVPADLVVPELVSEPVEVAKEAAQVDAAAPVETAPEPKPAETAAPAETEAAPEPKEADAAAPAETKASPEPKAAEAAVPEETKAALEPKPADAAALEEKKAAPESKPADAAATTEIKATPEVKSADAVAPEETKAAPEPKPADAPAPVDTKAVVEAAPVATAAPVEVVAEAPTSVESAPKADQVIAAAPTKVSVPEATSTPAPTVPEASESVKKPDEKTEKPATPSELPVAPKAALETATPAVKTAPKVDSPPETKKEAETPKVAEPTPATPTSPAPTAKAPTSQPKPKTTPEKSSDVSVSSSDSPPLAHTPSKEELPKVPAAKSEERRKPAGKLQLSPPAAADPLPTPDSELEDAATLAQSIIASELPTPTVTSPSSPPSAKPASPQQKTQEKRLSVEEPEVPTPPVGAVSLAQIGVKPSAKGKSTTAAQIESSLTEKKSEPATPTSPTTPSTPSKAEPATPTDAPKKKVVKKVVKKEGTSSGEAPVPPPRKKEKKPKEK